MLQRSTPGAQLTSASGVCRLRAPIHRGWTKLLSVLMEWDPSDASWGTRPPSAPGVAGFLATGGRRRSIGLRATRPRRVAQKQRGLGVDPGSVGACGPACVGQVLG